jgi:ectoine utilization protein EutC
VAGEIAQTAPARPAAAEPVPGQGAWLNTKRPTTKEAQRVNVHILKEAELRHCVSMDQHAMAAVSEGFTRLAEGKASLPPIIRVDIAENHGEVDVKTAYIHGLDRFAIKIASGFSDNPRLGLPYGSGMMVVISAKTGFLEAILLDNGYLTELRTGLAGAIAAQHLARTSIKTAGIIGSGMQARYQARGLNLVRDFDRLLVYGPTPEHVQRYIEEMQAELGVEVIAMDHPEQVVRESDVVVTTTPSRQPYLRAEWLHPGLHVTCMGSDAEHKQELYPDVIARADRLVCDRKSQCLRLGELHHALDAGVISEEDDIFELGELTAGRHPGREGEDEITICDLTGVGVQDTAIALLALERARAQGLGTSIEV